MKWGGTFLTLEGLSLMLLDHFFLAWRIDWRLCFDAHGRAVGLSVSPVRVPSAAFVGECIYVNGEVGALPATWHSKSSFLGLGPFMTAMGDVRRLSVPLGYRCSYRSQSEWIIRFRCCGFAYWSFTFLPVRAFVSFRIAET